MRRACLPLALIAYAAPPIARCSNDREIPPILQMSVLTTLLDTFRLRAKVFHNAQYCGTWGVDISGRAHVSFHFVASGSASFRLRAKPNEVVTLRTGDLLVLPHDASHLLGSPDCSVEIVNEAISVPYSEGSPEDATALVCGSFEFDRAGPNPVVAALPEFMILHTADPPHAGLLAPMIAALEHESRQPGEGSEAIVNRMAEILFVHLLRMHLESDSQTPGLLAALADDRIRRALELITEDPAAKRNVTEMAAAAGMSRSAFSERFKLLTGIAPMEYCTRWRMQQAYRWLSDEGITVLEAALRCGYEGESAFSRAFKRVIGCNPSAVRRG